MKWLRAVRPDCAAAMWVPLPGDELPALLADLVAVTPADCEWQVVDGTESPGLVAV